MAGRRIYLVGSSGYPHYGDELVAASWLRYLAATEPDAEVWLDCPNPGGAQLILGGLHPNLRFVDTVFRIALAGPEEDADEIAAFSGQAARQPGFGYAHRAAGVELLQTADVYHVIGGSYINTIWPQHLGLLAAGAALAEDRGAKVAATGLSLLPSVASGSLLDKLTAGYEIFDVAEAASKELLSGDNVTVTGDDSLLGLGDGAYDTRDSVSTMVCMQSDLLEVDVDALVTSVVESAKAWGLNGEKVGYLEAIPGQDRVVFEKVESELPGIRFYPFTEIWREGLPARRGQRWLTTRPQLHLAAAAAGAWGVAFPVRPGYDDVQHQHVIDAGSRWVIGSPGEAAPQTHGDAGFGSALPSLTSAKRELAARIYAR